jgi:hypothetical protein
LFISESGTGITILLVLLLLFLLYLIIKKFSLKLKIITILLLSISSIALIATVVKSYSDFSYIRPINLNLLDKKTINKSNYENNVNNKETENGYYVGIYQSWHECKKEWNKRSSIDANSFDHKGQEIRYTMMRYITSKGLRKDSIGISKLSKLDIKNIEKGITNYKFAHSGFSKRINDIFYEYKLFKAKGAASGHSVYMRLQFWKTAINIIKLNPIWGVGEGDINDAFISQYKQDNSNLEQKYWLRAHNQFLNITVAFGIVGLLFFVYFLFSIMLNNSNFYLILFMIIAILSFINEDTLETSTGAVFFAFFASLYSFRTKNQTND